MGVDLKTVPEAFRKCIPKAHRESFGVLTVGEIVEKNEEKLEKQLHADITSFLRMKGVRVVIHSRTDRKSTNNVGLPDLCFVFNSTPMAFEVKRPGKNPSPEQEQCIHDMQMDGWSVYVVRSLQEVRDILSGVPSKIQ